MIPGEAGIRHTGGQPGRAAPGLVPWDSTVWAAGRRTCRAGVPRGARGTCAWKLRADQGPGDIGSCIPFGFHESGWRKLCGVHGEPTTSRGGWNRVIAHVDMDAFYASIEIRDDPSLAGKPVVVGGGADTRGVVSAASYEARVFGVHSAMPMAQAVRLCPDLIRIPVDMAKYQAVSRQIMEILRSFSPCIEPLSLDEAFLDLTGCEYVFGPPERIARRIKETIRERTALTASVGVAPVKFVAKIASDLEKPDGLVIVEPERLVPFLLPLPITRLWGVGPRTKDALTAIGIRTIGQLARTEVRRLQARFGIHGEHLHRLAHGLDERDVVPDWDAKSYSHEETFARDQEEPELLYAVLLDQSVRVARRLRRDGVVGRTVQLKLRYPDFTTLTRQRALSGATSDEDRIYETSRQLFDHVWTRQPVRLLGVGVSAIQPDGGEAFDLFTPAECVDRRRRLSETVDRIEDRFGRGKMVRARTLRKRGVRGTGSPSDRPVEE
ncbi:MAG: DNA polymerase IV [Candidatus Eisenbacteria bacterium]|uniref:DNA polymerase IV n=1 Tax=Eiseniibacteriota bacterium TaxID=2212470 RepID=A0A956M556_UNCEI|nr:DNA polymerase IV [Candidatus Eisenbacteria bacterium]